MNIKYRIDKSYFEQPVVTGDFHIYQIGRLFGGTSFNMPTHVHRDLFELTIITGGKGVVTTNNVATPVEKGDIYLSFPGDFHQITTDKVLPLEYDFFAFQAQTPQLKEKLDQITISHVSATNRVIRDPRISFLVGNILSELCSEAEISTFLLNAILIQLLVYLTRDFENMVHAESVKKKQPNADIICYQLMTYIDAHIYSLKNLETIAQITNYNYSYLSKLFHKTTGTTVFEYYNNRRLDTAKMLLQEDKLSVTSISEMLNYSTPFSFSRAFKNKYNCSPKNYQKSKHTTA